MESKRLPNRWLIAAAATVMQLCLGSVYSWSVFVKPLHATEGWDETTVTATFTIAMAFLGLGSVIGGSWQDRMGPRVVSTFAGALYGVGFLIASWSVTHHFLYGLWLGYGLCCGLAMGMGYVCPVATITKWFPDRRGMMTGLAVMGFGFGALFMSPIAGRLIVSSGVPATLMIFGIIYGVVVIAAAQTYSNPPHGWHPEGWVATSKVAKSASRHNFTVSEALRTRRFWMLWAMLSLNTSAGIMIISQASPLLQQQVRINPQEAAFIVGIIGIFNGAGRIFWAWMSDIFGRAEIYFTLFALQVVLFFVLPNIHEVILFTVLICMIELCYGGGFGVMPSFTADFFGPRYVGGIYGFILLGWGLAAIPSPLLMAHIHQTTGQYETSIFAIGFVMLIALTVPILAKREGKRALAAEEEAVTRTVA